MAVAYSVVDQMDNLRSDPVIKEKIGKSKYELQHDKTNNVAVRPAKTQISLGIRPVWSESLLSAWRKLGSLATHWAHSEDSDQNGWMPRLICLCWANSHFVGFVMRRHIFLLVYAHLLSVVCSYPFKKDAVNDQKFLDRYAWSNSVDPVQTEEQSDQVYTVWHSICIFWTYYSVVKQYNANFKIIEEIFWVSEFLGILWYFAPYVHVFSFSWFTDSDQSMFSISFCSFVLIYSAVTSRTIVM